MDLTVVNPNGGDPLTRDDCDKDMENNLPHSKFPNMKNLELRWNIAQYKPTEQAMKELDRIMSTYRNYF